MHPRVSYPPVPWPPLPPGAIASISVPVPPTKSTSYGSNRSFGPIPTPTPIPPTVPMSLSSSHVIDLTEDEEMAQQLQQQFDLETRLVQERIDAQLAASMREEVDAIGSSIVPPSTSPALRAKQDLALALDREIEAKVSNLDGSQSSYRQQLKESIRQRKKLGGTQKPKQQHGKKKTPEAVQAKSALRAARLARRTALRERELRLEQDRLMEHGASASRGNGNQFQALEGMIETSASESDEPTTEESEEENDDQDSDESDDENHEQNDQSGSRKKRRIETAPNSTSNTAKGSAQTHAKIGNPTPPTVQPPTAVFRPAASGATNGGSGQYGQQANGVYDRSFAPLQAAAASSSVPPVRRSVYATGNVPLGTHWHALTRPVPAASTMMTSESVSQVAPLVAATAMAPTPMTHQTSGPVSVSNGPVTVASSNSANGSKVPQLLELSSDESSSEEDDDSDIEILDHVKVTPKASASAPAPAAAAASSSSLFNTPATNTPFSLFTAAESLSPVTAFLAPGQSTYRSPLTYGTQKPKQKYVPPRIAKKQQAQANQAAARPSSVPPLGHAKGSNGRAGGHSLPASPENVPAAASGIYLPPPDPAFIDPYGTESGKKRSHASMMADQPLTVMSKSQKKAKKAARAVEKLARRQAALSASHQPGSYAQAVAASNAAAYAVASGGARLSGTGGPRDKFARYAMKHNKPASAAVPPAVDQTPLDPINFFTSDELLSIISDWTNVRHVILVDLDNWSGFFRRLPYTFSDDVYLWVFHGKNTVPRIARSNVPFNHLKQRGHIQFTKCGERPDAADFALMLKLGELNQLCAKSIPFTLFSGDRGFDETLVHISDRRIQRVDPHHAGTDEETFALLKSIADT